MKKLFLILLSTMHFLGATTDASNVEAEVKSDRKIYLFNHTDPFDPDKVEGAGPEDCFRYLLRNTMMHDYFEMVNRLAI